MSTVRLSYASPEDPAWKRLLIETLELAGGRCELEKLYAEVLDDPSPMSEKWGLALERLRIEVSCDRSPLAEVPPDGPVVVVGNHPFGVVDGLILLDVLASLRDDYFVLVNAVLCREQRLEPHFLPIDFDETPGAVRTNVNTRRQALERLQQGGALGIFPAGGAGGSFLA